MHLREQSRRLHLTNINIGPLYNQHVDSQNFRSPGADRPSGRVPIDRDILPTAALNLFIYII